MAALARLLWQCGWRVSGCDSDPDSERAEWLRSFGIEVVGGHSARHISSDLCALLATPAVSRNSEERLEAEQRGVPIFSRGEVLAALLSSVRGIAVCGSHGKTTVSCFTTMLLRELGEAVSWCIGGKTPALGGVGGGEGRLDSKSLMVAESDESDGTLALYRPEITIVNAIDLDHVDFFQDESALLNCFKSVLEKTKRGIALCADSARTLRACENIGVPTLTFGIDSPAQVRALAIESSDENCSFIPEFNGEKYPRLTLPFTGRHNILNALAAASAALLLGHDPKKVFEKLALSCSQLPDRRFQTVGSYRGARIITDYAHHPQELEAMRTMATSLKPERLTLVFQPHRYSRTKAFLKEFPQALSGADETILLPVYAASEAPIEGGSSFELYRSFKEAHPKGRTLLAQNLNEVKAYLKRRLAKDELLLLAGAGSVVKLTQLASTPPPGELDLSALIADKEISIERDTPLKAYNFYRTGGNAEFLASVQSIAALQRLQKFATRNALEFRVLGAGANSWISDLGLPGITVNLAGSKLGEITRLGSLRLEVPCNLTCSNLLKYCSEAGLGGLEALDSIPGTIGGMLAMNAGAFGFSLGEAVHSITCLEGNGEIITYKAASCGFSYRSCPLLHPAHGRIALSCQLNFSPSTTAEIEEKRASIRARRLPLAGLRSEGSVFRNPPGESAGKLLEEAGCKKLQVGGARVSDFHANIIIAEAEASSSDILALIGIMRSRVLSRTGLLLEPEIRGIKGESDD